MSTVLVVHAAATWFMVGLIWTIQVVHYPMFPAVGSGRFADHEAAHTRRMGRLLVVPAAAEVITAAVLPWVRPSGVALWVTLVAGGLLAAVWVVTALVQVPLHRRLLGDADRQVMERLVVTNRWRTAIWSLRGALAAVMLLA